MALKTDYSALQDFDLDHGVVLTLRRDPDGWRWAGWKQAIPYSSGVVLQIPEPNTDQRNRAFKKPEQARDFLRLVLKSWVTDL
jgi:hypothetical protein